MDMLTHIQLMAGYNRRMNNQVYAAAGNLTPAQLAEDRGAFFGSVLGTLNHLMVADLIWLRRFLPRFPHFVSLRELVEFPEPGALDALLYDKLPALRQAREHLDDMILSWVFYDLQEEDLDCVLTYINTKGYMSTRHFGELVMHLLNHQTHHRGQATTLLTQLGQDVGVTDFLADIPVQ